MKEETQGLIAQLKNEGYDEGYNEGYNEGYDEGKLEVLDVLLKSYTIGEITNFFGMPFEEACNVFRD